MRILHGILLLCAAGVVWATPSQAGPGQPDSAVMLDIIDGETAFIVDPNERKAWWVVGECKRPLPIAQNTRSTENSAYNTITSEIILEDVRIGDRQVRLQQQFRFNLATTPNNGLSTVEVFNSLRGGWSPVPIRQNANCSLDATCRARMESPEC